MSEPFNRIPITIEVAPDGLHVTIAYDGTLGSIPAAIERLRSAGVLDLVQTSRAAAHTAPLLAVRGGALASGGSMLAAFVLVLALGSVSGVPVTINMRI